MTQVCSNIYLVSDNSSAAGWKSGGWLEDKRRVEDLEAANCWARGGKGTAGREGGGAEVARCRGTTSGLTQPDCSS